MNRSYFRKVRGYGQQLAAASAMNVNKVSGLLIVVVGDRISWPSYSASETTVLVKNVLGIFTVGIVALLTSDSCFSFRATIAFLLTIGFSLNKILNICPLNSVIDLKSLDLNMKKKASSLRAFDWYQEWNLVLEGKVLLRNCLLRKFCLLRIYDDSNILNQAIGRTIKQSALRVAIPLRSELQALAINAFLCTDFPARNSLKETPIRLNFFAFP